MVVPGPSSERVKSNVKWSSKIADMDAADATDCPVLMGYAMSDKPKANRTPTALVLRRVGGAP